MRNIRLDLAYQGTNYAGWQRQNNQPTVQGELERAVGLILNHPVTIQGAGRTDAGVHALGQVASFATDSTMAVDDMGRAFNAVLAKDVQIIAATEATEDFHPRYRAVSKCYRYHIWQDRQAPAFQRPFLWAREKPPVPEMINRGLAVLRGRHDFAAFQSTGSSVISTVRTISRAELIRRGKLWTIVFQADGFLRRQVRAMVGALLHDPSPERLAAVLAAKDRSLAGPTAPAQGLFMAWVEYPESGRSASAVSPLEQLN